MPLHSVALALALQGATALTTLPRYLPVELMAVAEVNTAAAKPGDPIRFRVNKAVVVEGVTVVPVGTPAFGEVVSATDASGLGKSGRMTARLLRVEMGDTVIPLTGDVAAKGEGAGSVGVAVLITGVMGLFHRGNNAKIKAGEIVIGFVGADTALHPVPALP